MLSSRILDKIRNYRDYLYRLYSHAGGPPVWADQRAIEIGIKNQLNMAEEYAILGFTDDQIIKEFVWANEHR